MMNGTATHAVPTQRWRVTARRGKETQDFYVYASSQVEALGRIDKGTFRYKGQGEPQPIDSWAETYEVNLAPDADQQAKLIQDMGQRETQKG